MSKKWTMRLIDDLNIPHWIIEEEVAELRDTRKRVGFCDSQEDAELIIAAPRLKQQNIDLLMLLKKSHAWFRANYSYIYEDAETMRLFGDIESEIAKAEGGE